MKNNEMDREFDKLVGGRLKKLSNINLKEELQFRENVTTTIEQDAEDVFGE